MNVGKTKTIWSANNAKNAKDINKICVICVFRGQVYLCSNKLWFAAKAAPTVVHAPWRPLFANTEIGKDTPEQIITGELAGYARQILLRDLEFFCK